MKRIFLAITLASIVVSPVQAAGEFDGSTTDLVAVQSATAPDYPILMTCWYKAADATHRGTLIALSDDNAGGSVDALVLEVRGDVGGDPIYATATAAGSSSSAVTTGKAIQAGEWQFAAALFTSASSRSIESRSEGPPSWVTETTTRNVGDWTHLSVGALYDGSVSNRFNGSISDVCIFFGCDAQKAIYERRWLSGFTKRPAAVSAFRPDLFFRQRLFRVENDYSDWGPDVTNSNVTFDYLLPGVLGWDLE